MASRREGKFTSSALRAPRMAGRTDANGAGRTQSRLPHTSLSVGLSISKVGQDCTGWNAGRLLTHHLPQGRRGPGPGASSPLLPTASPELQKARAWKGVNAQAPDEMRPGEDT